MGMCPCPISNQLLRVKKTALLFSHTIPSDFRSSNLSCIDFRINLINPLGGILDSGIYQLSLFYKHPRRRPGNFGLVTPGDALYNVLLYESCRVSYHLSSRNLKVTLTDGLRMLSIEHEKLR